MQQPKVEKKKDTTTAQAAPLIDEKAPRLLFVDSLNPIEIVVSLSSLSKWYETKVELLPDKLNKPRKPEAIPEHELTQQAESRIFYFKLILSMTN